MTVILLQGRKQGSLGFCGGEGGTTLPKAQAFSLPFTPLGKGGGAWVVLPPPYSILCRCCAAVPQSCLVLIVAGKQSNGSNSSSSSLRTFPPLSLELPPPQAFRLLFLLLSMIPMAHIFRKVSLQLISILAAKLVIPQEKGVISAAAAVTTAVEEE